jgi:MoaA/NifB/PqqE/SkfB family radical SAM enzyme
MAVSSTTKKWRLLRTWTARHPMWCAWQVTYRCNFRCGFCGYWKDPLGAEPECSLDQIALACRKLDKLGSMFISLAGGEPLIRTDIVPIVEVVARYHVPFITTNGWFVTPQLARRLFQAGLWGVSVSIDYADPAMQDKRRGMPGGFNRAVRALQYLQAARVHPWQRVNVMTVLLHDNLDHIEPLLQLAGRHGAYLMVQPYGMLKTGNDAFRCRHANVAQQLLHLKQRYPNFLSNRHFLARFDEALDGGVPRCRAGSAFFSIDSLGEVSICVEARTQPVGNVYHDGEQVLMRRLRRAGRRNPCTQCWYNCRGEVEMLYHPLGLMRSLPTLLFDRGRAPS